MNKFTIEEIKNYLKAQDSLGDIFYNLSEENIRKANSKPQTDIEEIEEEDPNELKLVYNPKQVEKIVDGSTYDGLEWVKVNDQNIILDIISLLNDIKPYFTKETYRKIESRFNLDGERYRIIKLKHEEGEIMEKLFNNPNCKHLNIKDDTCLDCDLIFN